MAQIATTTQADPLGPPAGTRIDRDPLTGYLYALVKSTTANTWDLYRSINGGTSWTLHLSLLRTFVQEMGSTFISNDGHLYLSYRTNEGGQDRIFFRRCRLTNPIWGPETLTGRPDHGGTPGAIHQGMDIQLVGGTGRWMYIVIAVGTTFFGTSGITLYGVLLDQANGTHAYNNNIITGTRQWMDITGTHRIVPSLDIEHIGDGKSSPNPHLWITYGRTELRLVKLGWSGAGWSGPGKTQLLQSVLPALDGTVGRWDGNRWLMAVIHPVTPETVLVMERDRGNTRSEYRQSPAHPAGVIRAVGLSYASPEGSRSTGDFRLYAVGTADPDLYFVDYVRASGTWTGWTTVTTTDVLGAPPTQFSARRGSIGRARHDLAIGHPGSPNTVVSYHQTLTYSPNTPVWDVTAIGVTPGSAAEVSSPLPLDWVFSDPDPADSQSAWALSRQIGGGALAYFRASDSTWQAAEVKNAGGTTARTLAAGWGLTSDAQHAYKVKVWDAADVASLYSDAFVAIPSGKVNPAITSPTVAQVLNQDRVTVTWTVAEQTAYRVQLKILAEVVFDSGWVSGSATSYTPDFPLADGFGYGAVLQTRNLKGLPSDAVQNNFSVDFVEPLTGTLTVTPRPADGVIRVTITNPPIPGPLNANPYFETNAANWTAVGGAVARSTAQAHEGVASLLLTPDGVTASAETRSDLAPVTAEQTYRLSAWVRCAVSRTVALAINWYQTGESTFISQSFADAAVTANTWTLIELTATAPALAGVARLVCGLPSTPPVGHTLHIDEAILRPNVPAVASVDLYRRPVRFPDIFLEDFETAPTTLNANPFFETNTAGWSGVQATIARSTAQAHEGVASLLLTPDGVGAAPRAETSTVVATPGRSYRVRAWVRCPLAQTVRLDIAWFTAAGSYIASSSAGGAPVPANTWTLLEFAYVAPATAGRAAIQVLSVTPSANQVYIDEATIAESRWGPAHAGMAVHSNTQAHQGAWAYQLTSDGTDALGSFVETVKIPCTPGTEYMLDMWIAGSSAAKDTFAQLRFHDAGGGFIAAYNGIGKPPPAANAWEYRWGIGTAPAGATHMTLLAVVDSVPTAGDTIWVDEVRVRLVDRTDGVRVAAGLPPNATYDDWGAVSGVDYEYRAQVRSVIGTTVGGVWTA